MKKSEYYADIIQYIELRLAEIEALEEYKLAKEHYKKQMELYIAQQRRKEIDKWLDEEISYYT